MRFIKAVLLAEMPHWLLSACPHPHSAERERLHQPLHGCQLEPACAALAAVPCPVMLGPPGGEQHLPLVQVQTLLDSAAPASDSCCMSARRQQAACIADSMHCRLFGALVLSARACRSC